MNKPDTEIPENKNESINTDENKLISAESSKGSEQSSDSMTVNLNTDLNTEESTEKMDTEEALNKDETDQTINKNEINNTHENDTAKTDNSKDVMPEGMCEKQNEPTEEITKNVEEKQAFNKNDDATDEKIKELYDVLEKFINNGTDNTENKSDNIQDENVKIDDTNKEITSTEDSISDNDHTDNIKSEKELLEEKKATENKLEQKLKKLNPLVSLKANFQPRLSGGPNDLVVLDDGIERSKGVNDLMKRFLVHTAKKTVHKKTDVSIVTVEGGIIRQETINLVDDEEEEERAKAMQTPGAKFKKLREELEEQMSRKREEEWKKRQEQKKLDNEEDLVYNGKWWKLYIE